MPTIEEDTIEVQGMFGGTKRMNKQKYVETWTNHAHELKKLGIDVVEQTEQAAGKEFNRIWENQNVI